MLRRYSLLLRTSLKHSFSSNDRLASFTSSHLMKEQKKKDEQGNESTVMKLDIGRHWKTSELKIKSSSDLEKLWFVLQREVNRIRSDGFYGRTALGAKNSSYMNKVRSSMAKLQGVLNERNHISKLYRQYLEDEYAKQKGKPVKDMLTDLVDEDDILPEIDTKLLQQKFRDMRDGINNLEYIEKAIEKREQKRVLIKHLREKFDYKNKILLVPENLKRSFPKSYHKVKAARQAEGHEFENEMPKEDNVIFMFNSQIEQQLKENRMKISQEEVLRSHIKNWGMLDLKTRRKVLGHLNARRSRDAREAFLGELSLLSQKIQYEENLKIQERQQKE